MTTKRSTPQETTMADPIGTWHVEDDDTVSTRNVYRIVAQSAYVARREQGTTARPVYVATVYSAEAAQEIVTAHNTADEIRIATAHYRSKVADELAALRARVAELEATNEDLRRWIAQHQADRHAVDRALKDATDAAGVTSMHGQGRTLAPKVRDESVPPPGWEWDDEDAEPDEYIVDSRGVRWVFREGQQPLDKAWDIYDAEHGYAPDIAAARADEIDRAIARGFVESMPSDTAYSQPNLLDKIRADERARTERDIAAWLEAESRAADIKSGTSSIENGDFLAQRCLVHALEGVRERVRRGDYPKLPRGG